MEIVRRDVSVRGGELACFQFGPGGLEEPLVLAVHGITANSRAWLPVARALGERATLVAVDLRGRGRSNELPGPFGLDVHVEDLLSVLDQLGAQRVVLTGHSLGAYVVAQFGTSFPERVRSLVLVDGGLPIPGGAEVDLDAFLGPALKRLSLRFADRDEYQAWWRRHPAFQGGEIRDQDLAAYADHDLVGEAPSLRSSVSEEAVRADAAALAAGAEAANELTVPATMLCAPRGLFDEPNPMQPLELARAWAAEDPALRSAALVPDVNHYELTLGTRGAAAVAKQIADALLR